MPIPLQPLFTFCFAACLCSSSSYELQHALHMRSIMHCFVWRGVRGGSYCKILEVKIEIGGGGGVARATYHI